MLQSEWRWLCFHVATTFGGALVSHYGFHLFKNRPRQTQQQQPQPNHLPDNDGNEERHSSLNCGKMNHRGSAICRSWAQRDSAVSVHQNRVSVRCFQRFLMCVQKQKQQWTYLVSVWDWVTWLRQAERDRRKKNDAVYFWEGWYKQNSFSHKHQSVFTKVIKSTLKFFW